MSVLTAIAAQNASAVILEFEDLPLHQTYSFGDNFVTSGVPVQVVKFQPLSGTPLSGTAFVDNWGMAGSTGKELSLTNADLKFQLDLVGINRGIWLLFSDLGGGVNLGINGDVKTAANFADFTGITIGGVNVTVRGFPTGAILLLNGGNEDVESLTIGGAHLYVDYVYIACNRVPEPATIMLLGLGSLGLLIGKKK